MRCLQVQIYSDTRDAYVPISAAQTDEARQAARQKLAAEKFQAAFDGVLRVAEPEQPPEVRRDSFGRRCARPDPTDNPAFTVYAQVHGLEAARAAFGLWEEDPQV